MFATEFTYHRAASVDQAVQLLNTNQDAKLLAGGHSLIPLMKLRQATPAVLIDIGGIDALKGITASDGVIRIGALTTHGAIGRSPRIREDCAMVAEAAGGIGDPQVRNLGTIGGNVCHADPGSDWPPVLCALNARFMIQGPGDWGPQGTRTLPASEFFTGLLSTALAENELLLAVEVPRLATNQRAAYSKMPHPATSFSVVGAAAVVTVEDGSCTAASVVVGGLVSSPLRARSVENALVGQELTAGAIAAAADRVAADLGDNVAGDRVFASAEYRRAMAPVQVRRAISRAAGLSRD